MSHSSTERQAPHKYAAVGPVPQTAERLKTLYKDWI